MKKKLALFLAVAMMLSLCACGEKDPGDVSSSGGDSSVTDASVKNQTRPDVKAPVEKPNDEDKGGHNVPDAPSEHTVPAMSGDAAGFGVDTLESLWMALDFTVTEGDERKVISCRYNADAYWDDFVADYEYVHEQIAYMDYEYAHDLQDGTIWQKRDNQWTSTSDEGYLFPFRTLWVTPLMEMFIEEPVEDEGDIYRTVRGQWNAEFFNAMFSFVYEDAVECTEPVDVCLYYDIETGELASIDFDAETLGYFIELFVYDMNNVNVYVSFWDGVSVEHCGTNERYISDAKFDRYYVSVDELKTELGDKASWMSEEELSALSHYVEYFSEEGFLRHLRAAETTEDYERVAAVVLCDILDIDYEELWTNHFMSRRDADIIIKNLGVAR